VGAFVYGAGNFLESCGIPPGMAVAIMGVLVASFASTTLDTATRLQRYVVTELASTIRIRPLTTKHGATAFAVVTAGVMALLPRPGSIDGFLQSNADASWFDALNATCGTGGLLLWPLFGASNQLLAGLALMVITFYLLRRSRPVALIMIPGILMLVMPAWAMVHKVLQSIDERQWHLVVIGVVILALEAWMVVEAILTWRRARGQREPALPELPPAAPPADYAEVNP
jgi:carbon starvation protein